MSRHLYIALFRNLDHSLVEKCAHDIVLVVVKELLGKREVAVQCGCLVWELVSVNIIDSNTENRVLSSAFMSRSLRSLRCSSVCSNLELVASRGDTVMQGDAY